MKYFVTNQTSFSKIAGFQYISLKEVVEYFKNRRFIQLDSETTGFDPHTETLLTLQLGSSEDQFVIDATTVDLTPLKPLLEDKNKIILIHNAKFDLKWLYKVNIIPYKNIYDTFLAERIISTGITLHKKSLSACVARYCDVLLPKEVRKIISKKTLYTKAVLEYAATDVFYLEEIYHAQMEIIEREGLLNALKLDNLFVCVLAYTEYCGFKLDRKRWIKKATKDKEKLLEIEEELNSLLIDYSKEKKHTKYLIPPDLFNTNYSAGINWNSQKQVIPLFKELGLDLQVVDKKTKQFKNSIESKVLKPQKNRHKLVSKFLEYQKAAKLVSTYGFDFLKHINRKTQRIHTNFTQIMNTGRLSCGGSNTVNIQNIPTGEERECFTTENGNIFVVSDYAAQEGRVLAEYADDDKYSDVSLNPEKDLHSFSAQLLFPELKELSVSEIKEYHKDKRQKAKAISFAIPYGGNGSTIATNLSIPLEEGERIYNSFMDSFPNLKKYFKKVANQAVRDGYVLINKQTGRKSYFYNYKEFLDVKTKLESYVNSNIYVLSLQELIKYLDNIDGFQGLSPQFWSFYSKEKSLNSELFNEIKLYLSKYFRLKSSFEKKGQNYPIQGE